MKFDLETFKKFMVRRRHAIAHVFGWNTGRVETRWDGKHTLWVGFRCDGCGKLLHEHESFHTAYHERRINRREI